MKYKKKVFPWILGLSDWYERATLKKKKLCHIVQMVRAGNFFFFFTLPDSAKGTSGQLFFFFFFARYCKGYERATFFFFFYFARNCKGYERATFFYFARYCKGYEWATFFYGFKVHVANLCKKKSTGFCFSLTAAKRRWVDIVTFQYQHLKATGE